MIGNGLLQGLGVTAKQFIGTFTDPAEHLTTRQYPEEAASTRPQSRQFPILLYDGAEPVDGMRCVACRICEKECPPQCILIHVDADAAGKPLKRPRVFDIDYSVCMSCQICVEMCPFDAIVMDQRFEFSTSDRFSDLLKSRDQLLEPADYWEQTNPETAKPVNDKIRAKLAAKSQGSVKQ